MCLESKNLGSPFWPWRKNTVQCWNTSCDPVPEKKSCFSRCLWVATLHNSGQNTSEGSSAWQLVSAHHPLTMSKGLAKHAAWGGWDRWSVFSHNQRRCQCGEEDVSEADCSWRGLFLDYSKEAYGMTAHTAPDLVLWNWVFRVVSPSSLITKNKYLLIKADLFLLRPFFYSCTITFLRIWIFKIFCQ